MFCILYHIRIDVDTTLYNGQASQSLEEGIEEGFQEGQEELQEVNNFMVLLTC